MAKIAIAGSSIAGIDHALDAGQIGRALAADGHEIVYIVRDVGAVRSLPGASEARILQAPSFEHLPAAASSLSVDGVGFAGFLARSGFGDPRILSELAGEWADLLQSVRPDRIVALASPIAWLVGPQIAHTYAIAHGRYLPPIVGQSIALLPQELPSAAASRALFESANAALAELKATPLDDLSDLLRRCQRAHYGLEVLDPYLQSRQAPGVGVVGVGTKGIAPADGDRIAAFLDAAYPGINSTLVAMAGLGDSRFDVFLYGATAAMRAFLAGLRHVRVHESHIEALDAAAKAAAVVHHGTTSAAEQAILNGRPHLVLPWTNDQRALLDGLKALGVTWWKEPGCSMAELAGTLQGIRSDKPIATAATNVQRLVNAGKIAQAPQAIAAVVESNRARRVAPVEVSPAALPAHEAAINVEAAVQDPGPMVAPQAPEGMSKVFCALPFQHLCVGTEGTARICCVASDLVSENGAPMSLYTNSFDEVWNSEYMREVRRKILADEPVSQCTVCYRNEAATSASYRTDTGLRPIDSRLVDIDAIRSEAIVNDYRAGKRPPFIKLELGNLCNLRCRMCWGAASSEIERDPVHSQWAGGVDPMHAVWKGEDVSIGPDPKIGVKRAGIYDREGEGDESVCWTNGGAHFDVPLTSDNAPYQLIIDIHRSPSARDCVVSLNGKRVHAASVPTELSSLTIAIDPDIGGRELAIDIESERSWNSERERWEGLPLRGIHLRRQAADAAGKPVLLKSRLGAPGLWYKDDKLVFDELLGDGKDLRRLYVTGGEPLIEPRYAEILDYLIAKDAARNIDIELTTNGTVLNLEILDRLERFNSVLMTISVDGIGAVQEYIRYPSRWATIEKNIRQLKRPGFAVCAIPVVQAYNMLSVADICEFSGQAGMHLSLMNNLLEPAHLRSSVMPQNVHRVAAERMRKFLANGSCNEFLRGQAETLMQHFAGFEAPLDTKALREFNLFTNDLDVSRGQSFRDSLPDLFGLIEEAGYRWTYETKHAGIGPRRPARERAHAWI